MQCNNKAYEYGVVVFYMLYSVHTSRTALTWIMSSLSHFQSIDWNDVVQELLKLILVSVISVLILVPFVRTSYEFAIAAAWAATASLKPPHHADEIGIALPILIAIHNQLVLQATAHGVM